MDKQTLIINMYEADLRNARANLIDLAFENERLKQENAELVKQLEEREVVNDVQGNE